MGWTPGVRPEHLGSDPDSAGQTPTCVPDPAAGQTTPRERVRFFSRVPMGRMGTPEELAELVAWMASPACSFTTGATFDLTGGRATY